MKKLAHVRNALYGQPWMITQEGLDLICAIVENHINGIEISEDIEARIGIAESNRKEKYQVINGVAVLPVMGPIIPRATMFSRVSGVASFDDISEMLNDALSRMDVSAVMLRADSPGGAVIGCFECCTEIFEARKTSDKPIIGLIEGVGASACYALLSQCDAAYCTEGSIVGSIGVIAKMDNTDRQEKNLGNDVMVFRSAELKAPGTGPMTPSQIEAMQRKMMKFDAMFDDVVVRSRPGIDIEKVSTGDTWVGQDAVDVGLVDDVATFDELLEKYGENIVS